MVGDVYSKPVWISPTLNMWADVLLAKPCIVNRHYHPKPIWAYTISGKWAYLEHEWTATAGDFIFETPGESHTLVSYEHPDPMRVFFVRLGPADVARRADRTGRPLRRVRLHARRPAPTTKRSASAPTTSTP